MSLEDAVNLLRGARASAQVIHRAYEVRHRDTVIGTVELFERDGHAGLERLAATSDEASLTILSGPYDRVQVSGGVRTTLGPGPLLVAEYFKKFSRGLDTGVTGSKSAMPTLAPWWCGVLIDRPEIGIVRHRLSSFQVMTVDDLNAPHIDILSDEGWAMRAATPESFKFMGPDESAMTIAVADGFPEHAAWPVAALEWRAIPPSTSLATWDARIAAHCVGDAESASPEAQQDAKDLVILDAARQVIQAGPEFWEHPAGVITVARAVAQYLLVDEENNVRAMRLQKKLLGEYLRIMETARASGTAREAADRIVREEFSRLLAENRDADGMAMRARFGEYFDGLPPMSPPELTIVRRWNCFQESVLLAYKSVYDQYIQWVQVGLHEDGE